MSMTFTKLFSSITESTIWCESYPTRIVWITMLAMSDRKGRVWGSVPGLARRAAVSVEEARIALKQFQEPDNDSRTYTPECEGRRIETIDGGWRLLNYDKYRSIKDDESVKEYKRNWIKNKRMTDAEKYAEMCRLQEEKDGIPPKPKKSKLEVPNSPEMDKIVARCEEKLSKKK